VTREERVGAVFSALADPTRRQLLDRLARTPASASELAAPLPVSRQAVVKHLQALHEAGLVAGERRGREVRWSVTPGPLADAMSWMADVGAQWDRRLARLKTRVTRQ
jgi:DNA-binding transcriptional ArsR family regulator